MPLWPLFPTQLPRCDPRRRAASGAAAAASAPRFGHIPSSLPFAFTPGLTFAFNFAFLPSPWPGCLAFCCRLGCC